MMSSPDAKLLIAPQDSDPSGDLANYAAMSIRSTAEAPEVSPASEANPINGEKIEDKQAMPREIGGRDGPEPTRFGDWEKAGRCIDF